MVAILDSRLIRKGYGRQVINALPPARRTDKLEVVERFFSAEQERPASAAPSSASAAE